MMGEHRSPGGTASVPGSAAAMSGAGDAPVEVFATCPPSNGVDQRLYLRNVVDVARWSDEAGCKGILVYTDNGLVDPWLVSQIIIQNTSALCPLVAIQPVYMHPYTVAKIVTTLGYLYGRRVYLNMVAGGFKNDLAALNDTTPHDKRYDRLVEYTSIIKELLAGSPAVTRDGEFYKTDKLRLTPSLPPELFPGIFISGSSEGGLAAAKALAATAIKYPKPAHEEKSPPGEGPALGIRVGLIARQDDETAWAVAHARFPEDRKGQLTHQLAMKVSDSQWHHQLSEMRNDTEKSPYWLVPFENYKTFCPYLVGSYERVGEELARYVALGHRTFVLDVPPDAEELHHTNVAVRWATGVAR
jgi:alkanesulfonate monooxygenase